MSLISLTTDFGDVDNYAALLKARIYTHVPDARIVDISHHVQAFDITEAAYILENSYDKFPPGTIHVVVVNWFMDQLESFIVFEWKEHYFIGPNNGLFSLMFTELKAKEIRRVNFKNGNLLDLLECYAKGIAKLKLDPSLESFEPLEREYETRFSIQPVISSKHIRGTVIHIDHFENVIINVRKDQFENVRKGRNFLVYFDPKNPITEMSNSYSDKGVGDVLCLFNSANYLEIAVNMGKASSLLSLKKDETVQIDFLD